MILRCLIALLLAGAWMSAAEKNPGASSAPADANTAYPSVEIANTVARVVISTQRGSIDRFELLHAHPITLPKHLHRDVVFGGPGADGKPALAALGPFNKPDTAESKLNAANQHAWLINDGASPAWGFTGKDTAAWTISAQTATSVTLTSDPGRGLRYAITWTMDATLPRVSAAISVSNGTAASVKIAPSVIPIAGLHQDYAPNEVGYFTAMYHNGGDANGAIHKISVPSAGAAMTPVVEQGAGVEYVGLKSRFFAAWWTPGTVTLDGAAAATPAAVTAPVSTEAQGPGAAGPAAVTPGVPGTATSLAAWRADVGGYLTSTHDEHRDHQGWLQISYSPVEVPAGRTLSSTWQITVSGLAHSDIQAFSAAEQRIELADFMHDFFIIFTRPMVWLLDLLAGITTSHALAVILLTLLIKSVLFRLTWAQHASMYKMQKLAPEMKALQNQYSNDRQKMAQKTMELYKKHQVNPLGGCLPILIQMPIFIALYNAFSYHTDFRGASFLWVNDLTLPDQLIGVPLAFLHGWVLSLNPLPLIYIAVTVWMSMSTPLPTGGDPQQEQVAKMMRWLPVIFGVIFYNMPAGLVLYFTVNAILSTAEAKFVRARMQAKG